MTIATLVAAVTLTFFIITLRPDVGGTEDSPKFQFVGRVLGTSHSPGYPFYAMATWLFGWLPVGNLAYRINLFSAVCGALCCTIVFLTARRLGVTRLLSVAAAFGAATSYPVWSNSVTAEVYTLAAALSGGAIYFLIAFAQSSAFARKASFGEIPPEPTARTKQRPTAGATSATGAALPLRYPARSSQFPSAGRLGGPAVSRKHGRRPKRHHVHESSPTRGAASMLTRDRGHAEAVRGGLVVSLPLMEDGPTFHV